MTRTAHVAAALPEHADTPEQTTHSTNAQTPQEASAIVTAAIAAIACTAGVTLIATASDQWWVGAPAAALLIIGALLLGRAFGLAQSDQNDRGAMKRKVLARIQLALMLSVHLGVLLSFVHDPERSRLAFLLPAIAIGLMLLSWALGAQAELLNAVMQDQNHLTPGRSGAVLTNPTAQLFTTAVILLIGFPAPFLLAYGVLVIVSVLYLIRVAVVWVFTAPTDHPEVQLR